MPQFVRDVEEIRQRAINKIEEGPVTKAYGIDQQRAVQILNEALATEIVCVLRYMHHYFMATGVHGRSVADEFKEHADAEREHADQIADRIQQLGGKPDMNPGTLVQRSVSQYVEGETLADMIREDLIAERVVIEVYTEMIRFFGDKDPTTRVMIEGILKDEEEHANDLTDLLYVVDPRTGETEGQDPGTRPLDMHPAQSRRGQAAQPGDGQRSGNTRRTAPRAENMGMEPIERPAADEAVSPQPGRRGERKSVSNLQATQKLERGELRQQSRGREGRSADTTRNVEKGEMRPARASGQERPAAGRGADDAPEREPGTRGRPPRKGVDEDFAEEPDEAVRGGGGGRSRAVHVTNPNRKRKKVA